MGSRYLTDLATVVRGAGLVVQEEPGWQSRSRSSGGYDSGRPDHVMVHHTASGASSDGQPDVNYMCYSSENRPVANLYLARAGKVWIMAAGATNTNGSGTCPHCGTTDNMNTRAIGIEAGNNGTGEPWPTAQQDAYVVLVAALRDHYGVALEAVQFHATYAPSRKIDPAGPSRWASSGTWPLDPFQADVAEGGGPPPPTGRKKKMYVLLLDDAGAYWATDNMSVRYLYNPDVMNAFKSMLAVFGYGTNPTKVPRAQVMAGHWGPVIGNPPSSSGPTVQTWVEPWGHAIPEFSGMGGGRADQVLQDTRIRASNAMTEGREFYDEARAWMAANGTQPTKAVHSSYDDPGEVDEAEELDEAEVEAEVEAEEPGKR